MRVLVLLFLYGCPRSASIQDAAPIVDASSTPSSSASAKPNAVPKALADLTAVVRAWNAATNAHDEKRLAALYADQLELYGTKMSRERATSIKKAAFAKHARDDLGPISVTNGRAMFEKTSRSTDGKTIEVAGYIDVDASMKITAEGDTTTDTNLARKKESDCMGAIVTLVEATTEGKEAAAKCPGRGIVRPDPTGNPHYWTVEYLAVMGGDTVDQNTVTGLELVKMAEFEVYDQKPSVVTGKFGPYELTLNPALASNMRAACK